jgi:hypothetical protein
MSLLMFVLSDRIGRLGRLGAAMFYLLAFTIVVCIRAYAKILRGLAGSSKWCLSRRQKPLPGPISILRHIHPLEYITKLRNASKKCKQNFLNLDFKASKISKFKVLLVFWPVLNVALKAADRQSASFGVP